MEQQAGTTSAWFNFQFSGSEDSDENKAEVQVQCRFASTETLGTNRDGEPRTATSTFTLLLSSVIRELEFEINVALRPQRPYGRLLEKCRNGYIIIQMQ